MKFPLIPALYTAIIVSFHDGIEFVVTQRDSRKPRKHYWVRIISTLVTNRLGRKRPWVRNVRIPFK